MEILPSEKISVGMIFGVFDGLHPGHQFLIEEACRRAHSLIIVVAHDDAVLTLKGHCPQKPLQERCRVIRDFCPQATVLPGDAKLHTWSALTLHHPDVVFLGYDQTRLGETLREMNIPTRILDAHQPHRYKSSLLNEQS